MSVTLYYERGQKWCDIFTHIDFDIFGYFVENSSISCVFFVNIRGYLFCTFHIILMDIIFVNCDFFGS